MHFYPSKATKEKGIFFSLLGSEMKQKTPTLNIITTYFHLLAVCLGSRIAAELINLKELIKIGMLLAS